MSATNRFPSPLAVSITRLALTAPFASAHPADVQGYSYHEITNTEIGTPTLPSNACYPDTVSMKNYVNKLITSVWRSFPSKCFVATVGMLMVCLNCNAQGLQTIKVQGKDSSWRLVGTVEPMTGFQIGASGEVSFGGLFESDSANAGVTGNAFVRWCRDHWGDISTAIKGLEQVAVAVSALSLSPSGSTPSVMHWNWVDYINDNGPKVNYDEGAFFVVITTSDQPPSKGNTSNQVAAPALYYWYNQDFKAGNDIAYDKRVWIWVKVHDGGRDPFSTSSFGDNSGSYTIWIDPDSKITDNAVELSSKPIALKPGFGTSAAALVASGKAHHVAAFLKRSTPSHHPR